MVLPTFFGPPHMCAVCVDFKDRADALGMTHWLTTLKDSATQLLMKYKSGALVTQCWPNTMMNTPQKRFWSLETYYDQGVIVLAMGYTHEDWERQIADSSNSIKNKHMNICEEDLRFDITMYLQLAYGAFGRHCTNWGYLHKYLFACFALNAINLCVTCGTNGRCTCVWWKT